MEKKCHMIKITVHLLDDNYIHFMLAPSFIERLMSHEQPTDQMSRTSFVFDACVGASVYLFTSLSLAGDAVLDCDMHKKTSLFFALGHFMEVSG